MPSNKETFSKYLNPTFLETGSWVGDGIQQALNAGFKNVLSIELSEKYYNLTKQRFITNENVKIFLGDSYKILPQILETIDEPITFWLDGHYMCGDSSHGDFWAPLMQELDAIKNHKIKTHTIMIDDMRCWLEPNETHGFYTPDIINKLKEINPDYRLTYEDGYQKNDILVAHI